MIFHRFLRAAMVPAIFFCVILSGNALAERSVTFTRTANEDNPSPEAVDDAYETNQDTPIIILIHELLLNDSDPDGDAIQIVDPPDQPVDNLVTQDMPAETAYGIIESAGDGDVVQIAPGTYSFRVNLLNDGATIRAQDPNNKPIFDYSGQNVGNFPGSMPSSNWLASYAWIIRADRVTIENIVIRNVTGPTHGTGIFNAPQGVAYEPSPVKYLTYDVTVRGVEIYNCIRGIESVGFNFVVEDSIIHDNGAAGARANHNFYIQGGTIFIRGTAQDKCQVYNATTGQNFNFRSEYAEIDNCTLGPVASYQVLLNTPKATMTDGQNYVQKLVIKNTTISGERIGALNFAKMFSLENGKNYSGLRQEIELLNNDISGDDAGLASIVRTYRSSGHTGFGIRSVGNTYSKYSSLIRLSPSTEDMTDPFYDIDVQDVADPSLP